MTVTADQLEVGYPETSTSHGPTERQQFAHNVAAWIDETLYGGALGGGKTDWLIAEVLRTVLEWPGVAAGIFRRSFPELSQPSGIIPRLLTRIPPRLGSYNGTEHRWQFRPARMLNTGRGDSPARTSAGSTIQLGYVKRDADVVNYLGAEYVLQAWDQLDQHTEFQYRTLRSRLRTGADLERAGLKPRSIATANPGGRGHGWIKRRWITPAPANVAWQPRPSSDDPTPGTRVFIPALLADNPHLGPSYLDTLGVLDPELRRAWLEGDWDVLAGQRFAHFRRGRHVIEPGQLAIPLGGVRKAIGLDYGGTAPFCALWGALFPGRPPLVVVYRELYRPGLTPVEQADLILASEAPGERLAGRPIPVYADPSTWGRSSDNPTAVAPSKGSPPPGSIAARYRSRRLPVVRANNNRRSGAVALDEALAVHRYDDGVELPGLLIYSTCLNLIRTLPELMRDDKDPEDVDTDGEDHAYDALRYLLLGLAGTPPPDEPDPAAARARPEATITAHTRRAGY